MSSSNEERKAILPGTAHSRSSPLLSARCNLFLSAAARADDSPPGIIGHQFCSLLSEREVEIPRDNQTQINVYLVECISLRLTSEKEEAERRGLLFARLIFANDVEWINCTALCQKGSHAVGLVLL